MSRVAFSLISANNLTNKRFTFNASTDRTGPFHSPLATLWPFCSLSMPVLQPQLVRADCPDTVSSFRAELATFVKFSFPCNCSEWEWELRMPQTVRPRRTCTLSTNTVECDVWISFFGPLFGRTSVGSSDGFIPGETDTAEYHCSQLNSLLSGALGAPFAGRARVDERSRQVSIVIQFAICVKYCYRRNLIGERFLIDVQLFRSSGQLSSEVNNRT